MSESIAADNTSEQNVWDPLKGADGGLEADDREFAPCVPPPAPHVHPCALVVLPDLWWELLYEHPGFMCEFCEGLENTEYSPDGSEIVGVFCESCRIKIARLPANGCPGSAPGCLAVRWVGPLGEIADYCRACAHERAPKKHSAETSRRRGKRGGRKVRARKESLQARKTPDDQPAPVEPGHASRPYGLEIQLGKMPGLRIVESGQPK
jgi:hypothetical protein